MILPADSPACAQVIGHWHKRNSVVRSQYVALDFVQAVPLQLSAIFTASRGDRSVPIELCWQPWGRSFD